MELDYVKLKEIKPALSGYIREAQILLRRSEVPDEKAVHDIRVLMKKSRALLNLASQQIDNEYHEKDIADLREVGRMMCTWRETSVQRKTLKEFRKEHPDIFSRLSENTKLNQMLEKQESLPQVTEELKDSVMKIEELLKKTGYRLRFQTMKIIDPQLLIKELDASYRKVIDIYISCRNHPTPKLLHRFRKTTKNFLYQLYIFRPLNPPVVKSLEKKLDILTQNLGRFNDIFQIITALDYKYEEGANTPALDELIIKFKEVQDGYLSNVWSYAYQIFCPGQNLVNILGFKLLVI
jgi:CHAD domain-containing protein